MNSEIIIRGRNLSISIRFLVASFQEISFVMEKAIDVFQRGLKGLCILLS